MQLLELLQRCAGPQQRGALLEHSVGYSGVMEEEEETLRVSAADFDVVPCQNTLWGAACGVCHEGGGSSHVCSDIALFSDILTCFRIGLQNTCAAACFGHKAVQLHSGMS